MPEMTWLDATAQADLVRRGEVSPKELAEAAIARIEAVNPQLDAVIRTRFDAARLEADGDLPDGAFRGVPILFKDLGCTVAGEPTAFGVGPMREVAWPVTSYLAEQFRAAGFVALGRTNVPELGTTVTTEPRSFPPARNPWDPGHSTGGSSGGSAAAVAAAWCRSRTPTTAAAPSASRRASAAGRAEADPRPGEPGPADRGGVGRRRGRRSGHADRAGRGRPCSTRSATGCRASRTTRRRCRARSSRRSAPISGSSGSGCSTGRARQGYLDDPECRAAVAGAALLLEALGHHLEESAPAAMFEPEFLGTSARSSRPTPRRRSRTSRSCSAADRRGRDRGAQRRLPADRPEAQRGRLPGQPGLVRDVGTGDGGLVGGP